MKDKNNGSQGFRKRNNKKIIGRLNTVYGKKLSCVRFTNDDTYVLMLKYLT